MRRPVLKHGELEAAVADVPLDEWLEEMILERFDGVDRETRFDAGCETEIPDEVLGRARLRRELHG